MEVEAVEAVEAVVEAVVEAGTVVLVTSRRLRFFLRGLPFPLLSEKEDDDEEEDGNDCCGPPEVVAAADDAAAADVVAKALQCAIECVINRERMPSGAVRVMELFPLLEGDSNNLDRRSNSWLSLKLVAINNPSMAW